MPELKKKEELASPDQVLDLLNLSGNPIVKKNKIKADLFNLAVAKIEYLLDNTMYKNGNQLLLEIIKEAQMLAYKPAHKE